MAAMGDAAAFSAAAATWQNFYLLVGTAAATLMGLMFVAVTFGASVVNRPTNMEAARAFLDPALMHFVQVLFAACVVVIPTMHPLLAAALLFGVAAYRGSALVRIHRTMRRAHAQYGDVELSDWISGVVLPAVCHLVLAAVAVGFVVGHPHAFGGLAAVTMLMLFNGIYGAWELVVWLAMVRSKPPTDGDAPKDDP